MSDPFASVPMLDDDKEQAAYGKIPNPFAAQRQDDVNDPFASVPIVGGAAWQSPDVGSAQPEQADGALGALWSGGKQTGRAVATAFNVLTDDEAGVRHHTAEAGQIPKTPEQQAFMQEIQRGIEQDGDDSVWQGFKNVGRAVWNEPVGAFHETVAQLPNSAVVLGGMYVGAKTGAMAGAGIGTAVAPGPGTVIGTAIGAVTGGITGMFVGNTSIETGFIAQEQVHEGEYNRDKALRQGRIKGGVTTGIDVATLSANRYLFGAPGRAIDKAISGDAVDSAAQQATAEAVTKAFAKHGVDVTDNAAVVAAMAGSREVVRDVREAGTKAYWDALPKSKKAAMAAAGITLESFGEGAGEYLGSVAAGLDASFTEAVMEGLMSLPQSAIETGVSAGLAKYQGMKAAPPAAPGAVDAGPAADPSLDPSRPPTIDRPPTDADLLARASQQTGQTVANSAATREALAAEMAERQQGGEGIGIGQGGLLERARASVNGLMAQGQASSPAAVAESTRPKMGTMRERLARIRQERQQVPGALDPVAPRTPRDIAREQRIADQEAQLGDVRQPEGLNDPRLKRLGHRIGLRKLAQDIVKGGDVSIVPRQGATRLDNTGNPLADFRSEDLIRTPSVNPEWFQSMASNPETQVSVKQTKAAVDKAMKGERLGVREARVVQAMLDQVTGEREEQAHYVRRELQKARDIRALNKQGLTDAEVQAQVEMAGEMLAEVEYNPEWTGESRAIFELTNDAEALGVDAGAIEDALSVSSNSEAARRMWALINEARTNEQRAETIPGAPVSDRQVEGEQGQGPRSAAPGATQAQEVRGEYTPFAKGYHQDSVDELMRMGISRENAERASTHQRFAAPVDAVTGLYEGRRESADGTTDAERAVEKVIAYVDKYDAVAFWVSADVANLGGLNQYFSNVQSEANVHYRALADIVKTELAKLGAQVDGLRTGGDEFGAIVVGSSAEKIGDLVQAAKEKAKAYARENGLHEFENPKYKGDVSRYGLGLHLGYTQIRKGDNAKTTMDRADLAMDQSKTGAAEDVSRSQTTESNRPVRDERPEGDRAEARRGAATPSRGTEGAEGGADAQVRNNGRQQDQQNDPGTPVDLFGAVPAREQAMADANRKVDERLRGTGDTPAAESFGDLLSPGRAQQTDITTQTPADAGVFDPADFTPTHELSDGTPVIAGEEANTWLDADGVEIQDNYATPIKAESSKEADTTAKTEKPAAQAEQASEPNFEDARALMDEQRNTLATDKKAISALKRKVRTLAKKTPPTDERTIAALDIVATRLDMENLEFAEVAQPLATTAPAEKPKTTVVSANTVFTEDAAEKARALLRSKLGQINSGIDPEMMQAGITLAGYHIEKGARTFAAYSKAMIDDLGDAVKPYLKSWYMGVKYDPRAGNFDGMDAAAKVESADVDAIAKGSDAGSLSDSLYRNISEITDNNKLKAHIAEHKGIDKADVTVEMLKEGQEAMELALVHASRDVVAKGMSDADTYQALVDLYKSQPNLDVRSSTSMENQAYSTPAPVAFVASRLAGIDAGTTVYEPTAGNGMLLIGASTDKAIANELNDLRAEQLREQGFQVTQHDASQYIPSRKSQSVIMNPPFGKLRDSSGAISPVKVDGYAIKAIDHLIAAKALESMQDDGSAVMIIGADKVAGKIGSSDKVFFNWLYSNYNVVDHFEIDGKMYNRQGAGWPIRVITIVGRVKSDNLSPETGTIERVTDWGNLYERYNEGLVAAQSGRDRAGDLVAAGEARADNTKQGNIRDAISQQDRQADDGGRVAGARSDVDGTGLRTGPVSSGQRGGDNSGSGRNDGRVVGQPAVDTAGSRDRAEAKHEPAEAQTGKRADTGKPVGSDSKKPGPVKGSAYQSEYKTRSNGPNDAVLTPVNMADATEAALKDLEGRVGDLDQYVMDKLGYDSLSQMYDSFMGLQIDAIAATIDNIEQGNGVIIADQTGVGKGRQAAAIIRYAMREGKTPIFITVKDNLFTDMYNDLSDIGTTNFKPFILNQDGIIKSGDKVVHKNPARAQHVSTIDSAIRDGQLPDGYDGLFLTYSQLNQMNRQRSLLNAVSGNAVFIMDESHNAAGDRTKIVKGKGKQATTAGFVFDLIKDKPTVYLSATYAKRPDNMPIYYRTDLNQAVDNIDQLSDAVSNGGMPLQTVIAGMLARNGQLFRRERSFDGIRIDTYIDSANREAHSEMADKVSKGLRAIVDADKSFHSIYVENVKKSLDKMGATASGAGNKASKTIDHQNFTSVLHNYVSQLLLGLKADKSADMAIELHKKGIKPVLALENTMASFLSSYAKDNGLSVGDKVDATYRDVLSRALERTRSITIKDQRGEDTTHVVGIRDLDPVTRRMYQEAQDVIDNIQIDDIPLSPIDWVRNKLNKAGISVAEITGRDLIIDYSTGEPVLAKRDSKESKDRRGTVDKFNGGALDALVLNAAGATGLSIHASEKFKDQKPRHMIVMQAAADINILMQMLGRVNRTGQVVLPAYTMMGVDIPAEKRPLARTALKMKSLNANTSANTEADTSVNATDVLNKYGDQVVAEYLNENPDIASQLDVRLQDPKSPEPDYALKVTGRLAMMPVDTQRSVYEAIEAAYESKIDFLNKTGQNDLEPSTMDLDARVIESRIVYEGKNPESLFGGHATMHKVDSKYQGKPPVAEEVRVALREATEGTTEKEIAQSIMRDLDSDRSHEEAIQKLRDRLTDARAALAADEAKYGKGIDYAIADMMTAENKKEVSRLTRVRDLVPELEYRIKRDTETMQSTKARVKDAVEDTFLIGNRALLDMGDERVTGVVVGIKSTHKQGSGSPYSLSKIRVNFLVNSGVRHVDLPLSQLIARDDPVFIEQLSGKGEQGLDSIFRADLAGDNRREQRFILTGNLIAGAANYKGRIASFTDGDGKTHQGILMPKSFSEDQFYSAGSAQNIALRDNDAVFKFLRNNRDALHKAGGIFSADQSIRLTPDADGGWKITVPKSNNSQLAKSVKFDQPLRDAIGKDFFGKSSTMSASFGELRLKKVIAALSDLTMLYALPSQRQAWVDSGGQNQATATKSFDGSSDAAASTKDDAGNAAMFSRGRDAKREALARTPATAGVSVSAEGKSPAAFVQSLKDVLPGLSSAIDKMIVRGKSGKRGGLVILDGSDPSMMARGYLEAIGEAATPGQMIDALDDNSTVHSILRSKEGDINAFYDANTGMIFMSNTLDSNSAAAVLLHEATHGQKREKLDATAKRLIDSRGKLPIRKETRAFLDRVATRIDIAGETNNTKEYVAYIVEQAAKEGRDSGLQETGLKFIEWIDSNIGKSIGNMVRDFLSMIRSWGLRHGVPMKLTTDDLVNGLVDGMVALAHGDVIRASEGNVRSNRDTNPDTIASPEGEVTGMTGKLPKTITIDGKERPTANSEGKPIADTREGVENFYRWFGDSKVVDEQGRPLVVYHGSNEKFTVFDMEYADREENWSFSSSKDVAQTYQSQEIDADAVWSAYEQSTGAARKALDKEFSTFADEGEVTRDSIESWAEEANGDYPQLWAKDVARAAGMNPGAFFGPSPYGQLVEAYLKLENPTERLFNGADTPSKEIRPSKEPDGYIDRGVMDTNDPGAARLYSDVFHVNSSEQIKSATENQGTFDGSNPDIRFSRQQEADNTTDAPPAETRFQKQQRLHQDKFNRFRVIEDWLKEKGINLPEWASVYKAEERYHGRVASRTEDFRKKTLDPLIKKIQKAGFTLEQTAEFLHAQHAEERNNQIAKVNPLAVDENGAPNGSGMTTEKASRILDKASPELVKLANEYRAISDKTRDMLHQAGVLTDEQVAAWEGAYQHYVPLKGGDEAVSGGTGQGFTAKNKSKRALGHGARDEMILENIQRDHERAIMLVEKNRVGKILLNMILDAGHPDLFTIGQPKKRAVLRDNKSYKIYYNGSLVEVFNNLEAARSFVGRESMRQGRTGGEFSIETSNDPAVAYMASPMLEENETQVYVDGHAIRIQFNDELLARAYNNLGTEHMGAVLRAGRSLNSFLSKMYTGYSIDFIFTNAVRDWTTGLINLTGEEGALFAAKAAKNYAKAAALLSKYAATGNAPKIVQQYREDGGTTGAAYLSDLERLGHQAKTAFEQSAGMADAIRKGKPVKGMALATEKAVVSILAPIERLNMVFENAMRLSAYMTALDSGMSRDKAASLAKNATVNFNRKGEIGQQINALWLFHNASIQGTAVILHALFKGKNKHQAQAAVAGLVGLGYLMAATMGGGDEDEYEKLAEHVKERNLTFKTEDGWITIPIPYGYGAGITMGRKLSEVASGKTDPGKAAIQIAANLLNEATIFGTAINADDPDSRDLLFLTPTAIQIPGQVVTNRSSFHRPLRPEPYNAETPDSQKMYRNTIGSIWDDMAGGMNRATGGNEVYSGWVDVSPETLKYIWNTFTGGTGRGFTDTINSVKLKAQGADPELREIPIVRRFVRDDTVADSRSRFWEYAKEAQAAKKRWDLARKTRSGAIIGDTAKNEAYLIGLAKASERFSKAITAKRDLVDQIRNDETMSVARRRMEIKRIEKEEEALYDLYVTRHKQVLEDQSKR